MITIALALLLHAFAAAPQPPSSPPRAVRSIDGRLNPELIPPEIAWEQAFRVLVITATDEKGALRDDDIASLSRYELHISHQDVMLVVQTAKDTLAKLQKLRAPFEEEHSTGVDLGWSNSERNKRQHEIVQAVLDARNQLSQTLSPASLLAVNKWIERSILPGTKLDIVDKR